IKPSCLRATEYERFCLYVPSECVCWGGVDSYAHINLAFGSTVAPQTLEHRTYGTLKFDRTSDVYSNVRHCDRIRSQVFPMMLLDSLTYRRPDLGTISHLFGDASG
ncbi:unnamed protein product, partial [Sphacelaria rigidula]